MKFIPSKIAVHILLLLSVIVTNIQLAFSAFPPDVTGGRLNIGINHELSALFCTIAGGAENTNDSDLGVISGGADNAASGDFVTIGGGFWNIGGAGYATICGGSSNNVLGEYSSIGGGFQNLISSAENFATIGGGAMNTATLYATIAGGGRNLTGDYGAIGGGYANTNSSSYGTIAGGAYNTASYGDAIGGGANNNSSGGYSFIGGGNNNTNISSGVVIGGGEQNSVSASYGTIPGGAYAKADKYGQQAYASGPFATKGDAQGSIFVLRRATASSSTTELFLDGSGSRMTISSGGTWTFEILVSARSNTGNSGGYRFVGLIENNGGTTAIVGAVSKTVVGEDVGGWDANASADNTNDALVINVNGDSDNVRWVATVRTSEVKQ